MNIIGIDLGTTNSCVAIAKKQSIKVIENQEGYRTTPSVIAYTKHGVIVGESAKRQSTTNAKNTFFAVKRFMGRKYNDTSIQHLLNITPYKTIKHTNGDIWMQTEDGRSLSPQQISAEVLKKMKKSAEIYLGRAISEAVITVPAYFNDSQRQATKDAGRIAGLSVKRIINEPTAAALAFGMDNEIHKDKKIAVYDLGGGTFDISIIEISQVDKEKQFEVLSTNGDTNLGGEDFDNKIVQYILDDFYSRENITLSSDSLAVQRIKEACEKAKIELSSIKETEINLPYIYVDNSGPRHIKKTLSQSKIELLVEPLIKKTLAPCQIAIKDAKLSITDIDDIILVGGMTRMPMVQHYVEKFFNRNPKKDINPDEAVAIGAAIQAQVLSGDRKDLLLLDVTPLSLGIETVGGIMTKMICKNTTIPAKYSQIFSTAEDNQQSVGIKVYQGERHIATKNKCLGEFTLDGISPAPRGIPQIEVVFDIDSNGILHVSAIDKKTNKENKIVIRSSSGLSEDEINNMIKDAEINEDIDKKQTELITQRNNLDSLIGTCENFIKDNKGKNSPEQLSCLRDKLSDIKQTMASDSTEVIKNHIKDLKEMLDSLKK
ncbi:molecular chaperone DnaK [Candidatus Vidania fulgoroideorum]